MMVRSFRLSDYASVTGLFDEVLTESCFEETMAAFARQLTLDSDLVVVAQVQEEIVGVLIGTISNNKGYYYRIAVSRDYQRRGIGSAMVEFLRKRFIQRRVSRLAIPLDAHNEPVLPLYQALGIENVEHGLEQLVIVNG